MGQQSRAPGVLRARVQRALRQLYPGFALRADRFSALSLLSIAYVVLIILTAAYLVVPLALLPALRAHPWRTAALLLAFAWTVSACLVSYLLTACADAGRIPDSWRPPPEGLHPPEPNHPPAKLGPPPPAPPVPPAPPAAAAATMLGPDNRPRYCAKCRIFKPDRAHHCSSCARCVLVMDHHCPFTGNACIGFMNRKFFVLFLYYAAAGCTMVSFITPPAIMGYLERMDAEVGTHDVFWLIGVIFGYMMCFVHALALSGFSAFHTYLVLKNRTTIENNEPRQVLHGEALRRLDQTAWQHWCAIMGRRPLLWFVPVSFGCEGDGVNWRRVDDVL